MMTNQYRDLPQIPRGMEDQGRFVWPAGHEQYGLFGKQHIMRSEADFDLYPDEFDNSMASPQPVQGFIKDHEFFDPRIIHAKISSSSSLGANCEQPWPFACYTRNLSPECPSVSGLSSHASHSDIQSPHMSYSNLCNDPTDYSRALLFMENFHRGSHLPEYLVSHTIVNPRDVEYDHEVHDQEAALQDSKEVVIEQENSSFHESSIIELKDASVYRDCPDSGIGQSVRDAESVQPVDLPHEPASDSDYYPIPRRTNKRKRSSVSSTTSSCRNKCRTRCREDSSTSNASIPTKQSRRRALCSASKSACRANTSTDDWRPFPCPFASYGCASHFVSKNEWKRHVSTQHIKQGFWRCDMCPPTTHLKDGVTAVCHNDFNRIDLFRQHLRRMHAGPGANSSDIRKRNDHPVSEASLAAHQTRCYHELRTAPLQSSCLFCAKTFNGPSSWAERMDHVGLHFEREQRGGVHVLDPASWRVDVKLEQYLLDEGLIRKDAEKWVIGDGRPKRDCSMDSEEESKGGVSMN